MPKTTIILEDELYKKLVSEAIDRFGSTRKLSRLINEKLRAAEESPSTQGMNKRRLTLKLGRKLTPEEIERIIEKGWKEAIKWKR